MKLVFNTFVCLVYALSSLKRKNVWRVFLSNQLIWSILYRLARAFHTKRTACSCEEKARIEIRFDRLKETLLESTITENHTRFVKFIYEKPKVFCAMAKHDNTDSRRHYDYYVQVKIFENLSTHIINEKFQTI